MRAAAPYQRPRRKRAVVSRGVSSERTTNRLKPNTKLPSRSRPLPRYVKLLSRPACGVRSVNPRTLDIHGIYYVECLSQGTDKESRGVFIEGSDVRAKRMARKAGSLIIFIVDASGSMALNRMNAAKGAAMSLLQEAYQSRDKICIVPFQVGTGQPAIISCFLQYRVRQYISHVQRQHHSFALSACTGNMSKR